MQYLRHKVLVPGPRTTRVGHYPSFGVQYSDSSTIGSQRPKTIGQQA
jgi:hypothetical protein